MGIDPAPFWANLHLYSYECSFITGLMSSDKGHAMKFRYATRFIDDNCNLNDDGEFGRSFSEIYPNNLEVKCEHKGTHATFLQLDITIRGGLAIYKLFVQERQFSVFYCSHARPRRKHSFSCFLRFCHVRVSSYSSVYPSLF